MLTRNKTLTALNLEENHVRDELNVHAHVIRCVDDMFDASVVHVMT